MKIKEKSILIAVNGEGSKRKDIKDVSRCKDGLKKIFYKEHKRVDVLYIAKSDFENIADFKKKLASINPDCVFNLFEGFSDDSVKEAEFVKILEKNNIPFTGNSSFTLEICVNKARAKNILSKNGIPVPNGIFVKSLKDLKIANLAFPLFIKPCHEDSSLGINKKSFINIKEDLRTVFNERIKDFPQGLLVEEFLPGDEYSVALLGIYPYRVLGVSVTDYSKYKNLPNFYTYASKWDVKSKEFKKIIPEYDSVIKKQLEKEIIELARMSGKVLKCRGYFRVDLREKNGCLFVIDVNPNPDLNIDGGYARQADTSGYGYEEIVKKIIKFAAI